MCLARGKVCCLKPDFDHSLEITKVIYITIAVESVNMSLGKLT